MGNEKSIEIVKALNELNFTVVELKEELESVDNNGCVTTRGGTILLRMVPQKD